MQKKIGVREDTLRLGFFFFFLFTPFSSYMTILTHIYEDAGMPGIGPATLACNYISFIISTFVAPALKIPLKTQLLFGGICYTINYSSGILVALTDQAWLKFFISCTGAFIAGASAGPLWVSQGRYIHLVCVRAKQEKRQGEMFGLFGILYCLSNISAGLITTFGLGFFNPKVYFMMITVLGCISIAFCVLFLRPIDASPNIAVSSESESLVQSQHNESIAENPAPAAPVYSPRDMLLRVFQFFPKMKVLITVLIIDGVCLGFYSSQITHLIFPDPGTSKEEVNKLSGYLLISLGVGATLGGILFSKISDIKSTLYTGRLGLFQALFGCGLFVLTLQMKAYALAVITAFVWGFFLFYVQGWMYLVCGRHFGGQAEAFSVNKQLHSIFYLIFQLSLIPSGNQIPLLPVTIGIALLVLPTIWLVGWVPVDYLTPSVTLRGQKS